MPVPIRDDGSLGPTEHLVVFVHGFSSNASCWRSLETQLRQDSALAGVYRFAIFDYETALLRAKPLRRLPSLEEVGLELGSYLERTLVDESGQEKYIDTTLVGHSMGGLVIQSYLTGELQAGRGRRMDRIRQVIMFATPNFGSELLGVFRRFWSVFFPNPQEEILRTLSGEMKRVHQAMREHVIDAALRSDHSYPLPCYSFWGDSDGIVKERSARGYFPHGEALRGDHTTLKEVSGSNDPRYSAFVHALIHPHGHTNIWEIESSYYIAAISPRRRETPVVAKYGDRVRLVETDNVARVERKVSFGRHNKCRHPFTLRYATRNEGWIDATMPKHVTGAEKLRQYEDTGTEVVAEVVPDSDHPSVLSMFVYKGFEAGHRNYHMHLGRKAYYRRLQFEVDLSAYLAAGWRVTDGPRFYYHPSDPGDHQWCKGRKMLDADPMSEYDSKGRWGWCLEHIKEGVIDIVWDVTPINVEVARESPSVIELKPGEHAVVGYGSLLSIASLERTLGRRYTGPFMVCHLTGWTRTWDISMPNSTFAYLSENGAWITPERILYLNIERRAGQRMNGVLFVITDDDLKSLDEREWIYDRVAVDQELRGASVLNGNAWAFVGKPEHILKEPDSPRKAAIRQTYLDILDLGIRELGEDFRTDYEDSTAPVSPHLLIQDHKRDKPPSGA
jgi:pimeloyl-ACP methyl ester carboxylesterase